MSSVATNPQFNVVKRTTALGSNRIVVGQNTGSYSDGEPYYADVFAFYAGDLAALINALQSFAVKQGKGV